MAKTLKDFLNERNQLGPMKVKNPDEQKFIDKHVVAKTPDRNGNDDELFKGSKVKFSDRPPHRKGYNPGDDEAVYEELKGNQHKIDANKNGKIDSHDFKLLRKKKKVAEEAEQIDEVNVNQIKKDLDSGMSHDAVIGKHANKRTTNTDAIRKVIKQHAWDKRMKKEEVEQIDELSTATLKSYRTKARAQGNAIVDKMKMGGGDWSKDQKDTKTLRKRAAGAQMSGKTLRKRGESLKTEEAEQIDELSKGTMGRYINRAKDQIDTVSYRQGLRSRYAGGDSISRRNERKLSKRHGGIELAVKKMTKEEAEQIDELSKGTLGRYAQKAKNQMGRDEYRAGVRMGQRDGRGQDAMEKAHNKRADKRHKGLTMAIDKLAKEETELDEKLDMKKASMGDVIKDFQDSNAPQFKGKSDKKRRAMAIAAKLTAERGGKPLRKEEKLAELLGDLTESHRRTMLSVFDKLNEDNQRAFLSACETEDGIDAMLDFSIQNRGE